MTGKGHYQLNLKGISSPFIHLKVIQRFNELNPGDTLCLEHIDADTISDLMAILKNYPLQFDEPFEDKGLYTLLITKQDSKTL